MHSVKDLFSRLSCRTSEIVKDYNEFKDWLKVGGGVSEAEQLKWIFESTKISDKAKRLLAKSIADEKNIFFKEPAAAYSFADSSPGSSRFRGAGLPHGDRYCRRCPYR